MGILKLICGWYGKIPVEYNRERDMYKIEGVEYFGGWFQSLASAKKKGRGWIRIIPQDGRTGIVYRSAVVEDISDNEIAAEINKKIAAYNRAATELEKKFKEQEKRYKRLNAVLSKIRAAVQTRNEK